jgi:Zn ribbon nucleic-acid-binding protein
MSLAVCANCTSRYALGLRRCPECQASDAIEAWKVDSMKMTQAHYNELVQRRNDGQATDDDRRLLKLYEKGGFELVEDEPAADTKQLEEPAEEAETYTGDGWTKDALVDECVKRGLVASGNKPELVARLVEHDQQTAPVTEPVTS